MWSQFFLENGHFTVYVLAAFVCFATSWLYFDAWHVSHEAKEIVRTLGFGIFALSFLVQAVTLESVLLPSAFIPPVVQLPMFVATRIFGYGLVILSLLLDPIQRRPTYAPPAFLVVLGASTFGVESFSWLTLTFPLVAVAAAFLYLRRSTVGLENHLKPVAFGFYLFSLFEFLSLGKLFRETTDVSLYRWVAPYGLVWMLTHVVLLLAIVVLGRWVFGYLLKRLQTQLFMIYTASILIIFVITSVTFTALLLKNIQNEVVSQLATDVRVLQFALESKKGEALSDAQVLATSGTIPALLDDVSKVELATAVEEFLLAKKQSTLVVVNEVGQVVARGEDREQVGDLLADDPLIERGLAGDTAAGAVVSSGVLSPLVSMQAVAPILSEEVPSGAVLTGTWIDSAFVDGVKRATGLEVSVYAGKTLSATTLLAADGKTRPLGVVEENGLIVERVLTEGGSYVGDVQFLNRPYFGAYLPILDVDATPVGMLFVGKPQISVLQTAAYSIELTFVITAFLLAVSIIPAHLISRYLAEQLE